MTETIELRWNGPYGWPKYEGPLPSAPTHAGVYLFTFEYEDGYLVYAAGITRRGIRRRLHEHTRKYLAGEYNILQVEAAQSGRREEVWHGWGWTDAKRREFEVRMDELERAAREQLRSFRVFVTDINGDRVLERVEAAVMNTLASACEPYCNIPDEGMHLEQRRDDEQVLLAVNRCDKLLYALPDTFEI
jgi:hypothetical protein